MIKAIFYSKFDVNEGPKVLHQVPADSIVPSPNSSHPSPLIHFPSVSTFVIPRPEFCSQLLTVVTKSYRILGHPICLSSPSYPRNEFLFNFCLVLDASVDFSSHLTVTLKLATLLRTLEEQSGFLSRDPSAPNTGKIYALCEILLEDLNNYCESMIPIDAHNTLNIKLFPVYAPPPPLHPHHVPLSTVRLSTLADQNWDLTMLLILPHINGVNSVRQIALLADADYKLVRKAISHLLYYNCIFLLDIFSFAAIYAPTAELADLVENEEMQAECARYVSLPPDPDHDGSGGGGFFSSAPPGDSAAAAAAAVTPALSGIDLVQLYADLEQGQSVKSFCIAHASALAGVDMRRFITFGVIKGFLYRVHKYAIATRSKAAHRASKGKALQWKKYPDAPGVSSSYRGDGIVKDRGADRGADRGRDGSVKDRGVNRGKDGDGDGDGDEGGTTTTATTASAGVDMKTTSTSVLKYLDGSHCFDEICTDLMISEKELLALLKDVGDVQIIYR